MSAFVGTVDERRDSPGCFGRKPCILPLWRHARCFQSWPYPWIWTYTLNRLFEVKLRLVQIMCTFSCWNLRSRFDSSQYFGPLTRSSLPLDARNRPYQEVDKWHFLLLEARLLDWMNEGAFTWASQLRSNNFLTQSRVTWVKRTWLD